MCATTSLPCVSRTWSSCGACTPDMASAGPLPDLDPALAAPGEYELVLTPERLADWVRKLESAELFAFDVETDSLDALCARLVGISLAVEPGKACYIPVGHGYPGAPAQLAAE